MELKLRKFSKHKAQVASGFHAFNIHVFTGITSVYDSSHLLFFGLTSFSDLLFNKLDDFYWLAK